MLIATVLMFVFFSACTASSPTEHPLTPYFGTYTGVSPTGRTDYVIGEIQITLSADGMRVRLANGTCVKEIRERLHDIHALSLRDVRSLFRADSDVALGVDGFRVRDTGPLLLFWRYPQKNASGEHEARLIMPLGNSDIIIPAVLYDQTQIADGALNHFIEGIVTEIGRGNLPRIKDGATCMSP